jgi:ATP-dependent Clp protease ATP-binding subunit ClpA
MKPLVILRVLLPSVLAGFVMLGLKAMGMTGKRLEEATLGVFVTASICTVLAELMHWLAASVRTQHEELRLQMGKCSKCGYDVRASKDVCPECGEPIPPKPHVVRFHNPPPVSRPAVRPLPVTPYVAKVLQRAEDEAFGRSLDYIGSEHILLALLDDSTSVAANVLATFDITREDVSEVLAELTGEAQPSAPNPPEQSA